MGQCPAGRAQHLVSSMRKRHDATKARRASPTVRARGQHRGARASQAWALTRDGSVDRPRQHRVHEARQTEHPSSSKTKRTPRSTAAVKARRLTAFRKKASAATGKHGGSWPKLQDGTIRQPTCLGFGSPHEARDAQEAPHTALFKNPRATRFTKSLVEISHISLRIF